MKKLRKESKSQKRAQWLYFILPKHLQRELQIFLSPQERKKLEEVFQKNNKKKLVQNFSQQMADLIHHYKKEKFVIKQYNRKKQNGAWYVAILHFLFFFYSLFLGNFFLSSSFFVYGILSTWLLLVMPASYWRSQLGFAVSSWAITLMSSVVLVVAVASLQFEFVEKDKVMVWIAVAGISAPLAEELIFRDLLYRAFHLGERLPLNSIVLTSFLFALAHWQSGDFPYAFFIYLFAGLVLAWLRFITGRLIYPLAAHALVNVSLLFI